MLYALCAILLPYLFHGFDQFVGGLSFLGDLNLVGIHKKDGFGIAEGHALGISIAEITFHSHSFLNIKGGMTERAGDDAGLASDAQILVDHHPVIEFRFSVACLCRADLNAIGLFTMVADHGKVDAYVLPLDHLDPRPARIA